MDHHICTDVLGRPLVGGAPAIAVFGSMLAAPGTFLCGVHVNLLLAAAVAVSPRPPPSGASGGRVIEEGVGMTEQEPSGAQKMFGDFAPGLVHLTDDVLFGEVWRRPQLSPRDRSLITVACLIAGGNAEQLTFHLQFAKDNGAAEEELIEAITHAAFYAGWPRAMSAMAVAKQVFAAD